MRTVRTCIVVFLMCTGTISRAQTSEIIQKYINAYKALAIQEMQRTGVPAAIKLAQGIHETMAGTSVLAGKSNNHFGIKCKANWTGESVSHDDDARGECFRKYLSPEESYRDHSNFLKSSARYAALFNLDPADYEGWAFGLKKAGYATNPKYPQVIIKLIKDYQLQDYTLIAIGKLPETENGMATLQAETLKKNDPITIATILTEEPATPQINYPGGEFRINETRVIFARKGMSFLSIAQDYNIPLARIFEFNELRETETLVKDQLIYLQRKRKTGNNEFHTVQPGETLYDIAQSEAIRLETLLEYNLLANNQEPAIGEQLSLRTKSATAPRLVLRSEYSLFATNAPRSAGMISPGGTLNSDNTEEAAFNYTVLPKETIYSIGKKHNVKIDDIVKWNQLNGYDLKMGQQLKIYK